MRGATVLVAATACLSLAACNNADDRRGAANAICTPFAQAASGQAAAPAGDPSAVVDDCLHRWAYSLAGSTDGADMVADAVVAACTSAVARWNQASLNTTANVAEAPSLVTGQSTNPIAEHYNFAQSRALFYVVQARAGKCAPPPLKNGAPEGIRY